MKKDQTRNVFENNHFVYISLFKTKSRNENKYVDSRILYENMKA